MGGRGPARLVLRRARGAGGLRAICGTPARQASENGLITEERYWAVAGGISLATGAGTIEAEWPDNPRGLLSVGYPAGPGGKQILINYIAVEPMANGIRGYSELETGPDGMPGLRWNVEDASVSETALAIRFHLDRFASGADVVVRAEVLASQPNELRLTATNAPGSMGIQCIVLTATMGNYAKLRTIRVGDRLIEAAELGDDFSAWGFSRERFFALPDPPIAVAYPRDDVPDDGPDDGWDYRGVIPLRQYWRVEGRPPLGSCVRVNTRKTFWASERPIPGGPAFENFELQLPYRADQTVIFGLEPATRPTGYPSAIAGDQC